MKLTRTSVTAAGRTLVVVHHELPGGQLPTNIVVGPGGASHTLLNITPRTHVARTWDLGCGSGVQAAFAATHSDHVIATDIDEHALELTRQTAQINNLDIETRLGSLATPVAEEKFDLIISNPPFVMGQITDLTQIGRAHV